VRELTEIPLEIRRKARNLIADQLDKDGRHDEARKTRAGMRDNVAANVLAASFWVAGKHAAEVQMQAGIAGCLAGMAIGFLAAYILLV
jgi:hypothetical protein